MSGGRFPLAELEALLGRPSAGELARTLRMSARHVQRLKRQGLSEEQADVLAVRAGFHPASVWSAWG